MLLHLLAEADWERVRGAGSYAPESLAVEGFVHCTGDDTTMLAVANRFYADATDDLVVLGIEAAALTSAVVWEAPAHPDGSPAGPDEPRFPHVYGPLDLTAVREVRRLRRDTGGRFVGFAPT